MPAEPQNRHSEPSEEALFAGSAAMDIRTALKLGIAQLRAASVPSHTLAAELLLLHKHEGTDLRFDYARDTLEALARVWKRPVNILTKVDGKGKLLRFDGRDHSEKGTDYPEKV